MTRYFPKELALIKFISELRDGQEFFARDVAKKCNMTGVEAGNYLKMQDNVRKYKQHYKIGTSWIKVTPG